MSLLFIAFGYARDLANTSRRMNRQPTEPAIWTDNALSWRASAQIGGAYLIA
jgi:hypothetical protein